MTHPNEHLTKDTHANRDPVTGEPGFHPIGTGVGAAGGTTAGAAIGAIAGPVGAAIGAVVGGVIGGFAGKEVGEAVDPTAHDAYWRTQHNHSLGKYEDYRGAYETGYTGANRYQKARPFNEIETDLRSEYEVKHSKTGITWDHARAATEAAYNRAMEERINRMRKM